MVGSVDVALSNQEDIRSGINNTGAVYGGINFGEVAQRTPNLPDFLLSRTSNSASSTITDMPLDKVIFYSVLLVVGALIIKRVT